MLKSEKNSLVIILAFAVFDVWDLFKEVVIYHIGFVSQFYGHPFLQLYIRIVQILQLQIDVIITKTVSNYCS